MLWVLLLLPPCASLTAAAQAQPRPEPWRVVLIRGWDSQYPVNIVRERALVDALLDNAPRIVEIYTEEVDALRFPAGEPPELIDYLRAKYSDRKTDLVIASGNESLEFASRYRDALWPDAPILFNGVLTGSLDGAPLPPRTTGVTMNLDVYGTVQLGLALSPHAKVVHFVAGVSDFDQTYVEVARAAMRRFDGRLEADFIMGLPRAETLAAVEKLDPRSLVVYLTVLRDGSGQVYGPGWDDITQVANHSAAPVLSAMQTDFLHGPLGGSSARFDQHGAAAGRIARRLLEGVDPRSIPVSSDPDPGCVVDWRRLGRWHLDATRIPSGCDVLERPASAWDSARPLVALGSIILLQAALIWALWMQSRRRRAAEAESQRRRTEIAHVARLSVMGVVTASIAHEINQPLGAILSNADAADLMIRNGNADLEALREILADIRSEDLRASQVIRGLRSLLGKREMRTAVLDVNTEVAEALHHVAHDAARRRVRVVPAFAIDTPPVTGDSVHLQQVLINLVVNAMDAMEQTPEAEREVHVGTSPRGRGVEISVADRGSGITAEHASQLFDSFFTTKSDGMGLGLSIVRTIVEAHGGRVWADSDVRRGATFRVWLPAAGT